MVLNSGGILARWAHSSDSSEVLPTHMAANPRLALDVPDNADE